MTNQELLDQAAYELGYIEYGASLDATDSADALAVLNQMMASWRVSSRDLNWFSQDTLGDTAPIPDWSESGVISSLAMKLSTTFNVAPSMQLVQDADKGKALITRTLINLNSESTDFSHLPQGRKTGGNILTGDS